MSNSNQENSDSDNSQENQQILKSVSSIDVDKAALKRETTMSDIVSESLQQLCITGTSQENPIAGTSQLNTPQPFCFVCNLKHAKPLTRLIMEALTDPEINQQETLRIDVDENGFNITVQNSSNNAVFHLFLKPSDFECTRPIKGKIVISLPELSKILTKVEDDSPLYIVHSTGCNGVTFITLGNNCKIDPVCSSTQDNEEAASTACKGESDNVDDESVDSNEVDVEGVMVFRYELIADYMRIRLKETTPTSVNASHCKDWKDLVEQVEIATQTDQTEEPITGDPIFGHCQNGNFYGVNCDVARWSIALGRWINSLIVIENKDNILVGSDDFDIGQLSVFRYKVTSETMEIHLLETFSLQAEHDRFNSWSEIAAVIFDKWQQLNGITVDMQVDPTDCWPGALTIFGRRESCNFTRRSWPVNEWECVKKQLNTLLLVEYDRAGAGVVDGDGDGDGDGNGDGD